MPSVSDKGPLVYIIGPTAVGKSDLAIQLALRINGEIISADSRYFYRGMDIGTAKPSSSERSRVPHHLIDILNPDESMSLAIFLELADQIIKNLWRHHQVPIMVGGSGQFYSAIVHGWRPPRGEPRPELRQILNNIAGEIGKSSLHEWLMLVDPAAAKQIDPSNVRRTIRALEVILSSGERFSSQKVASGSNYECITVGITRPREEIYRRVDERIEEMLREGWVEEVRRLVANGYPSDLPAFSAIGYREIADHIAGSISLEEAVIQIRRRTKMFVRRQANWFKIDDPSIRWFWYGESILEQVIDYIHQRLLSVERLRNE